MRKLKFSNHYYRVLGIRSVKYMYIFDDIYKSLLRHMPEGLAKDKAYALVKIQKEYDYKQNRLTRKEIALARKIGKHEREDRQWLNFNERLINGK